MLTSYIKSGYPVLWLLTAEENRAELEVLRAKEELKRDLIIWSATDGFNVKSMTGLEDPMDALNEIKKPDEKKIYVMRDLHQWFTAQKVIRLIRDIAKDFKQQKRTLIIISPVKNIPPELERDVTLIEFELPNAQAVRKTWDDLYERNKKGIGEVNEDEKELIVQAALGLTTIEAENAFSKALVDRKALMDNKSEVPAISSLVMREKALTVKKTGILEYFDSSETVSDIGGLENLKKWLSIRKKAFSKKAREAGIPIPKGFAMVGLPGCGKSLAAKATANALGIPLIRFDIGRVFAGLVGQSEANLRLAIQTIEAVGNCLAGDTEIVMSDGLLRRIDQIKVGDKVATFDEISGKILTTEIKFVQSRLDKTVILRNKSGDEIRATSDHKFLRLNNGKLEWQPISRMTVGDLVAVPTKLPSNDITVADLLSDDARVYEATARNDVRVPVYVRGNKTKYPESYVPVRSLSKEEWLKKKTHRVSTGAGFYLSELTVPSTITSEMTYAAGLLASDGCLGDRGRICFTNSQPILHTKMTTFAQSLNKYWNTRKSMTDEKYESYKKLPGISANPTLSVIEETQISSKLLVHVLRQLNKKLLSLDSELLYWWLAGYVDGDGSTSLPENDEKIAICSKKQESAHLVREVLRRLSIIPSQWNGRIIEVTGQRARDLAIKLNGKVNHPSKLNNIKAIIRSNKESARRDSSFKVGSILKSARKTLGIKSTEMLVGTGTISRAENNYPITEEVVEKINQQLHSPELSWLLNSEIRWVPITEIREGKEEVVYDISCEGANTHNFIANGFVSHNCVVWIDEMEKAFAGMGGSGTTDSGVSQRVFGNFITWMQEKKTPSFIVSTINRIDTLPPELLRKGRFDEIFFVGLPNEEEREAILKIHIGKDRRPAEYQTKPWPYDPAKFDLKDCIRLSNGFSGAELEDAVVTSLYSSFDKGKEMNDLYIQSAIMNTTPLSKSKKLELEAMASWAKDNAQNASQMKEETDNKKLQRQLEL